MPPVVFEPTISEGERPQTYALDRAVTGTGPVFTAWCLLKFTRRNFTHQNISQMREIYVLIGV